MPKNAAPPGAVRLDISPRLLIDNYHGELDAAALYRSVARSERSPERAAVLIEIAEAEERHASVMATRLGEMGIALPKHRTALRVGILSAIARVFGARAVLPIIETFEAADVHAYRAPEQDAAVQALAVEERGHFRTLGQLTRGGGAEIAQHERWHRPGAAARCGRRSSA